MAETVAPSMTIELTPEQVEVVRAALRLLLASEEDVEEIRAVKALLVRLERDAA